MRFVIPLKDCDHDEPSSEQDLVPNGSPRPRRPRLVSVLKRGLPASDHLPVSAALSGRQKVMLMSTTTHVIEVGDVTAGIIVAIKGGFRFFAAERAFKSLDLAVFPTIEDANRAAREKLPRQKH
ncbi:hypothetical protein [Microvirga pudoricolor]|uniref:hypothetical protein n=1 Tax=Microvirga pudoricolor TaxID=2778729 RepID=UPI00194E5DCE|nr:hypothetical protein [Microvirga pudoricolor]MBM6595203.1 hypothetical protein [Microvirga pudoricolor]